jgi:uncharacterized protein (TIGR00299 family) protein
MQALYFQPFSGASGDMILGALLDAGLSLDELRGGLASLRLPGWRLEAAREPRGPFLATRARVLVEPESAAEGGKHPHRHLRHILELIQRSDLPGAVKSSASAVFRRLGEAEARVHGIPVESVHFHEVGAIDSIVDITGACLGIHLLGVDEVLSAPIVVGTGSVRVAHGEIPLPAPATLELLKGHPAEQRETGAELTTPTGAAILTTLARSFGTFPALTVSAVGYGAGDDRSGSLPNVLRVLLGERATSTPQADRITVLEANVDDMSAEWIGHLIDRLLESGALDVSVTPILMKKSRPANEVKVLATPDAEKVVLECLFRESTTFGVRRTEVERAILAREIRPVETEWGRVSVKLGRLGEDIVTASPEFEDLRRVSRQSGLPLKEVHQRVMEALRASHPE